MRTATIRIESKDYEPVCWVSAIAHITTSINDVVLFRYGKYVSVRLEKILDEVVVNNTVTDITLTLVDEWEDEPYIVVRNESHEAIGYVDIVKLIY